MENTRSNKFINIPFAVIMLVFALLLFILSGYCNLYIRPISDDFWRDVNHLSFSEYLAEIKKWYLFHNGRYSNSAVSLIPFFYKLPVYRITAIIIQLLFIYAIKRTVDHFFNIKYSVIVGICFLAFYLAFCPAFYESFMWLASSNHYMLGVVLFILFLSVMFKIEQMKTLNYKAVLFALLLIFFLVGSNEIWLLLIPFVVFLFLVRKIYNRSFQFFKIYIFLFIFAVICLVFSYTSPSNSIRSELFPESKRLADSLIWSFKDFFVEIFHTTAGVFSPFYLVLQFVLLFLFSCILYFKKETVLPAVLGLFKNKIFIISGLVGAILITLFTVKYGQSFHTLGIGRVRNMRFLFNIFLIVYVSMIVAWYFREYIRTSHVVIIKNLLQLTIAVSVVFYCIRNINKVSAAQNLSNKEITLGNNLFELMYDYKNNRWEKYAAQWDERIEIARQSQNKDVVFLPLQETPLILENKISSYELRKDSSSYFNAGFALKHGLKSVKVSQEE